MLKQRVLTALILIPLVLAAIFALPARWFVLLLAIIFLGGCWEYRRLAGLFSHWAGYLLVLMQASIFVILFRHINHWNTNDLVYMSICCAAWLLMFFRLFFYRPGTHPDNAYRLVSFATAIVSVTTGWFAIGWIRIHPDGSWLLLLLLLIVWSADTGAYFAGRAFGKRKLAPQISPGKTQAGLLGGLIAASLTAPIAANLMPLAGMEATRLILLAMIAALISVGGDLMISLHKRTSGFKDSGNLLPGHGGVLDRLDSLMAAAPFFALGLLVTG
jgi:phosphatidate cytidylyltransferase